MCPEAKTKTLTNTQRILITDTSYEAILKLFRKHWNIRDGAVPSNIPGFRGYSSFSAFSGESPPVIGTVKDPTLSFDATILAATPMGNLPYGALNTLASGRLV